MWPGGGSPPRLWRLRGDRAGLRRSGVLLGRNQGHRGPLVLPRKMWVSLVTLGYQMWMLLVTFAAKIWVLLANLVDKMWVALSTLVDKMECNGQVVLDGWAAQFFGKTVSRCNCNLRSLHSLDYDTFMWFCFSPIATIQSQCLQNFEERVECGWYGIRKEQCMAKDCCWQPGSQHGVPWCYTARSKSSSSYIIIQPDSYSSKGQDSESQFSGEKSSYISAI